MRILLIILFICSFHCSSQLKIGVTGLYGKSIVFNDLEPIRAGEKYITSYDNNFTTGIYLKYSFNDWFSIKSDFLFDQINTFRGYYITADSSGTYIPLPSGEIGPLRWWEDEYWIRMDYLSFPLTFGASFKKWSLDIGAQYSYLIRIGGSSEHLQYYNSNHYSESIDFNYSDGFFINKRNNLSFHSSLSYNFYRNFSFEFRFNTGLVDIAKDYLVERNWTRQFQFGFSYQIWPPNRVSKEKRNQRRIEKGKIVDV